MNTDERDELWQVLGRAKKPSVSPFFARNVVREVRQMEQSRAGFLAWVRQWWKPATISAACAAFALVATVRTSQVEPVRSVPAPAVALVEVPAEVAEEHQLLAMVEEAVESPDYHVIGNLDELLESDDNSVWLSADVN